MSYEDVHLNGENVLTIPMVSVFLQNTLVREEKLHNIFDDEGNGKDCKLLCRSQQKLLPLNGNFNIILIRI